MVTQTMVSVLACIKNLPNCLHFPLTRSMHLHRVKHEAKSVEMYLEAVNAHQLAFMVLSQRM